MKDQRAATDGVPDRSAAGGFAEQLRALRSAAGDPSFRKMAGRSGRISHTTLHEAAAGTRFPSWETTREFVRACEADEAQWRRRWEEAQRPASADGTPDADPASDVAAAGSDVAESADADTEPAATGAETAGDPEPSTRHARSVPGDALSSAEYRSDLRVAGYPPVEEDAAAPRSRSPWLAAAAVVMVVAIVAVLGVTLRDLSSPDDGDTPAAPASSASPPSPSPSSSAFSDSLIAGDSSTFVADVTIPDGTRVKVNSQFVKVWALANVGKVVWHNRYLARTNPTADADGCQVPDRVAIGDTPPGEQVMISVPVTAPSSPGKCWVSWKMVDENGQEFFPTRRPVYFMVTVVA
ncbi:NBR1-Ig-like domain-containing protein [Micromonospora chokoriensis]|uniref:Helix-turn-helix domain-containing protein n=1 Tax=Micromonospora chokoriensis TaxID=356851 RepID=A0A1C4XG53_9ACTN|nr:NBR1-Ig-like domain-containing protein [Micromonospora chokoriensis]SCF07347.1 Helix-turn-helix domain-containing protein [Micromonospora chokoriensis]